MQPDGYGELQKRMLVSILVTSSERSTNPPLSCPSCIPATVTECVSFNSEKSESASCRTWVVGYREVPVDGASFIETQDGDDLLTRGRFWIDPTNGRVVRSELIAVYDHHRHSDVFQLQGCRLGRNVRRGRHVVGYRTKYVRWALRFETCGVRRDVDNVFNREVCHGRVHEV